MFQSIIYFFKLKHIFVPLERKKCVQSENVALPPERKGMVILREKGTFSVLNPLKEHLVHYHPKIAG